MKERELASSEALPKEVHDELSNILASEDFTRSPRLRIHLDGVFITRLSNSSGSSGIFLRHAIRPFAKVKPADR